jgi:hypothetical protein
MIGGMAVGKTVFWAENGGQAYFFVTELSEDDFLTSLEAPVDGDGESRGGDGE